MRASTMAAMVRAFSPSMLVSFSGCDGKITVFEVSGCSVFSEETGPFYTNLFTQDPQRDISVYILFLVCEIGQ